jgi:hypothetical protein
MNRIQRPARKSLLRRSFLGGAGALLGLPLLESLMPRNVRAADMAPKRLLAYYVPCGIHMQNFRPTSTGANYGLSPILMPLDPVRSKVSVLSGLANMPARPDGAGDHASGTGAFITNAHPKKTQGADIQNGISMDQVAAGVLGQHTAINSLQLGIEGGSGIGDCDSGYSCAYAQNISWADEVTPLPKLTNPGAIFDTMFAGQDPQATAEEQAKRLHYRTSILDYVKEDATKLQTRLGKSDKLKVEQYLTGVRELEEKLAASGQGPQCIPGDKPGDPLDLADHIALMNQLMTLAFQCDSTRVISFMLANAGSNRSYDFIGVSGGHHELSHHQDLAANFDKLTLIDTWEVQQFANLLSSLDAVEDIDGKTLLDNSLIFFSSEISDGNAHNHDDMPILLAGSAGGAIVPGRHVEFAGAPSVGQLFVSMLNALDVDINAFGDATGPLAGL